jgi:hypothetical protein
LNTDPLLSSCGTLVQRKALRLPLLLLLLQKMVTGVLLRAKRLLRGVLRSRHSNGWCSRCSCRC